MTKDDILHAKDILGHVNEKALTIAQRSNT